MLKFGFGGKIKPRRFDFIPRYYDETKDDLENRVAKYDKGVAEEEKIKHRISKGIRTKYYADKSYRQVETRKSNIRLLYVFIVLIFVSYMILRSDKIVKLLQYLEG
jgi:hypothetical protein